MRKLLSKIFDLFLKLSTVVAAVFNSFKLELVELNKGNFRGKRAMAGFSAVEQRWVKLNFDDDELLTFFLAEANVEVILAGDVDVEVDAAVFSINNKLSISFFERQVDSLLLLLLLLMSSLLLVVLVSNILPFKLT